MTVGKDGMRRRQAMVMIGFRVCCMRREAKRRKEKDITLDPRRGVGRPLEAEDLYVVLQ